MCFPQALQKLTKLTHVDLADSSFQEENISLIVAALVNQPALSHLNIRDGGLDVEGVEALAEGLAEVAPPLVALDLSGNDASEECLVSDWSKITEDYTSQYFAV